MITQKERRDAVDVADDLFERKSASLVWPADVEVIWSFASGDVVPIPTFPASVAATSPPLKVEVAEVEVASKLNAVTVPVNTPDPVTPSAVPGVVVPMPTKSVEVTKVTVVPLSCHPVVA